MLLEAKDAPRSLCAAIARHQECPKFRVQECGANAYVSWRGIGSLTDPRMAAGALGRIPLLNASRARRAR